VCVALQYIVYVGELVGQLTALMLLLLLLMMMMMMMTM